MKKLKNYRKAPNGMYWCNYAGKAMAATEVNEIEVLLLCYKPIGEGWKPSKYKGLGWFEKNELIENVTFFNWN